MKRLLAFTVLVVALTSARVFADQLFLFPNNGSGDNFGYITSGLSLGGGTDFLFFGDLGYPGGSAVGGGGELFLHNTVIDIDGMPQEFFFLPGSISMTNLTLPTNGKDVIVPEDISFGASGSTFDRMQTLDVSGRAKGWIAYSFSNGLYYPSEFHQGPVPAVTPELSTLGLIGTGVVGLAALRRNRFSLLRTGANPS